MTTTTAHAPLAFIERRNIRIDIRAIQDIANAVGGDPSERLSVTVIVPENTDMDVSIMRVDHYTGEQTHVLAVLGTGADGHFLEKSAPEKLLLGTQEVIPDSAPMPPSIAPQLPLFPAAHDHGKPVVIRGLTERELEVLSLLANGHSYKMISEQLQIAMGTVNGHVRKIYKKLRVQSMAGAVGVALKHGLV